jgi:FkbM family methyltransferase
VNVLRSHAKKLIHRTLNGLGFELRRVQPDIRAKFLGLSELPIRTILDIGANVGQFARSALAVFPEARIHSFEPQPVAYAELTRWATAEEPRVRTHRVALGDAEGTVDMTVNVDFTPSSSLLPTTKLAYDLFPITKRHEIQSVPLTTLDALVARENLDLAPDLLVKLDVQGYEDRVIRGGPLTFGRARACIMEVNVDVLFEGQPTFRDLLIALDKHGLNYVGNFEQALHSNGHVMYFDAVFLR